MVRSLPPGDATAASRRLGARVAFLGVDYQDSSDDALAFAAKDGVPYPSGVDADGAVGRSFGLYGVPATVFIDGEGRVIARYLGETTGATLDRLLGRLLAGGARRRSYGLSPVMRARTASRLPALASPMIL